MKPLVFVNLPIARFVYEVAINRGNLEEWTESLAHCLMDQDPSLNSFGAKMLAEVEQYRETKSKAGKASAEAKMNKAQHTSTHLNTPQHTLTDINTSQHTPTNTSNDVMSCIVSSSSVLNPNANTEIQNTSTVPARVEDDRFLSFWREYPKKVDRKGSEKAFLRALKAVSLSTLMDALANAKNSQQWAKNGGQYVPNPTTWLNQERWNDKTEEIEDTQSWAYLQKQLEKEFGVTSGQNTNLIG